MSSQPLRVFGSAVATHDIHTTWMNIQLIIHIARKNVSQIMGECRVKEARLREEYKIVS